MWRILLLGIIMGGLIILRPAALPSVPSLTRTRELLFKMQTPTRTPHPRTAKYEKHKIAYLTHKP